MEKVFSFDGRIGRSTIWIACLVLSVVQIGLYLLVVFNLKGFSSSDLNYYADNSEYWRWLWNNNAALLTFWLIAWSLLTVVGLSFTVRRWHDLDKSGWWVLIGLVPILGGIYSLVMLGFVAGDQGANRFGPPPAAGHTLQTSRSGFAG